MEGSSSSPNKRRGDDEQEGRSGGKNKLQKVTKVFDCSICSKRLAPPIFRCSKGNCICSPCHDKLPESERAAAPRSKFIEYKVANTIVTKGLGVFDCNICSKPLEPPIFQCSNGNPICSPCRDKLPESERAAAQRCYSMERVVDNIFVPCKYKCNRMPTYYYRNTQERECPAGPCACPVSGCVVVEPTWPLLDHLITLHNLPETQIDFFVPSYFPVQMGSQILRSKYACLFLLDIVPLDSFGHAIYLVCVRPEISRDTVQVIMEFSRSGRDLQVSQLEITPDDEPRQCLCVLPRGEPDAMVSIELQMVYIANGEVGEDLLLKKEEDDDDDDEDYDIDDEEEEEEEEEEED